MTRYSG
jgi:hypothetical protein